MGLASERKGSIPCADLDLRRGRSSKLERREGRRERPCDGIHEDTESESRSSAQSGIVEGIGEDWRAGLKVAL